MTVSWSSWIFETSSWYIYWMNVRIFPSQRVQVFRSETPLYTFVYLWVLSVIWKTNPSSIFLRTCIEYLFLKLINFSRQESYFVSSVHPWNMKWVIDWFTDFPVDSQKYFQWSWHILSKRNTIHESFSLYLQRRKQSYISHNWQRYRSYPYVSCPTCPF